MKQKKESCKLNVELNLCLCRCCGVKRAMQIFLLISQLARHGLAGRHFRSLVIFLSESAMQSHQR